MVFETLGNVQDMQITESKSDGLIRLVGCFGKCGIVNSNNRIYDKKNYSAMVESLQKEISSNGVMGELEHPNSYNINLNNVSHKIESIQMNEDGTITGTIVLLNTPKGNTARAIVEAGLPLHISSRGAGTVTNEGRVTLSSIKTYDLVGTPGFECASFNLAENQTLECLNESLEEGQSQTWIITESDDEEEPKKEDDSKDKDPKEEEASKDGDKSPKDKDPKDEDTKPKDEDPKADGDEDDKNKDKDKVTMEEINNSIKKLGEKIEALEAELHVVKESQKPINYDAIQKWIEEEYAPELKNEISESFENKLESTKNAIAEGVQNWATNEFAPEVQNWIVEEFSPEIQNWVTEEFAPEVQGWVTEEFAPEVQNWITEEFSPEIQNWITEEFAPTIDAWVNEELRPDMENKINENVSAFLESKDATRLSEIDNLLDTIDENRTPLQNIITEATKDEKYKGVYVVESMPSQYKPAWEMLSEAKQQEILTSSKMYDFTKEGVLESFWASVDFKEEKQEPINENLNSQTEMTDYHSSILAQMRAMRH